MNTCSFPGMNQARNLRKEETVRDARLYVTCFGLDMQGIHELAIYLLNDL
jgi:hypothetical protein